MHTAFMSAVSAQKNSSKPVNEKKILPGKVHVTHFLSTPPPDGIEKETKSLSQSEAYVDGNRYKIINILGDGNCLFRCFAHHVFGDQDAHAIVRKRIVEDTVQKWSEQVDLLNASCEEKLYRNPNQYKDVMGRTSVYGTDYETGVFARVYRTDMTIYRELTNDDRIVKIQTLSCDTKSEGKHLNIMFTGAQRSGHWVVLEAMSDVATNFEKVIGDEDEIADTDSMSPISSAKVAKCSDSNAESFTTETVQEQEKLTLSGSVVRSFTAETVKEHVDVDHSSETVDAFIPLETSLNGDLMPIFVEEKESDSAESVKEHTDVDYGSKTVDALIPLKSSSNRDLVPIFVEEKESDSAESVKEMRDVDHSSQTADALIPQETSLDEDLVPTVVEEEQTDSMNDVNGKSINPESIDKKTGSNRRSEVGTVDVSNGPAKIMCYRESRVVTKKPSVDVYSFSSGNSESLESEISDDGTVYSVTKSRKKIQKDNKSTFCNDISDDDLDNRSKTEKQVSVQKVKTRKVADFTVTIGTVVAPATDFKSPFGRTCGDKIRAEIIKAMLGTYNCTCLLTFYGSVRENLRDNTVLYAKCNLPDHKQRFRFRIFHLEKPISNIEITSTAEITVVHKKNLMRDFFASVRGPRRREYLEAIRYRSAVDFLAELQAKTSTEYAADGHMQSLCSENLLWKIKSEEKCRARLTLQSKDISDLMELFFHHNEMKDPFLRFVGLPLTAVMFTEEDLAAMDSQRNIILHMDSTGSLFRKPQYLKCKRIYYYSIIAKHVHEIINLAQMITSEHGIVSISTFLKRYKSFIIEKSKKWPFAKAIVVDWSWALINSILQEWNGTTIKQYLQLTYDSFDSNVESLRGMSVLKICFAHFMKIVSRTINDNFRELKPVKRVLMECMALLCLCRSMDELDTVFDQVGSLLLKAHAAQDNLIVIQSLWTKNRHRARDVQEVDDIKADSDEVHFTEDVKDHTIYRNSPYFKRYNSKLVILQNKVQAEAQSCRSNKNIDVPNKYYAPKFLDYILRKWMPYAILWSAIDLDRVDKSISRLSNAYIESLHRVLRDSVFDGNTTSSIADGVRLLETKRKSTIAKIYLNAKVKGTKRTRRKPKYPPVEDPFVQEVWLKKKGSKRRNVGYADGKVIKKLCIVAEKEREKESTKHDIVEICKHADLDLPLNSHQNTDTENDEVSKELCMEAEKEKEKEIKKHDIVEMCNNVKLDLHQNTDAANDAKVLKLTDIAQMEKLDRKVEKFHNGLVKDVKYYLQSNSSLLTVGRFHTAKSLTAENFQLTAMQFASLDEKRWIDGEVIDAFAAANIDNWIDVTYIPTGDTAIVIGRNSGNRFIENRMISKTTKPIGNRLMMPYLFSSHWRLFVVNVNEKKIMLLDPYGNNIDDKDRAKREFMSYVRCCKKGTSLHSLSNIDWEICDNTARPYQPLNDGYSCGVYVMHYMQCLGKRESFDTTFDPVAFRIECANSLLLKSESMEKTCLHCFAAMRTASVECPICNRKSHKTCFLKSDLRTDDKAEFINKACRTNWDTQKCYVCTFCRRYSNTEVHER